MSVITHHHIIIDDNGTAIIKDTKTKVVEIVVEHLAYGWSPEEIHFQHDYLSLGKIYAALSFYYDNKDEIDNEISERLNRVSEFKEKYYSIPIQNKLRSVKIK